jgi:hypothetical protein
LEKSIVIPSTLEKPRRRLIRAYHRLGNYQAVADLYGVNVKFIHEFLVKGIIPNSKRIRRVLGLKLHQPVTINQLLQLPIQDMPTEILRLALENRVEMK